MSHALGAASSQPYGEPATRQPQEPLEGHQPMGHLSSPPSPITQDEFIQAVQDVRRSCGAKTIANLRKHQQQTTRPKATGTKNNQQALMHGQVSKKKHVKSRHASRVRDKEALAHRDSPVAEDAQEKRKKLHKSSADEHVSQRSHGKRKRAHLWALADSERANLKRDKGKVAKKRRAQHKRYTSKIFKNLGHREVQQLLENINCEDSAALSALVTCAKILKGKYTEKERERVENYFFHFKPLKRRGSSKKPSAARRQLTETEPLAERHESWYYNGQEEEDEHQGNTADRGLRHAIEGKDKSYSSDSEQSEASEQGSASEGSLEEALEHYHSPHDSNQIQHEPSRDTIL